MPPSGSSVASASSVPISTGVNVSMPAAPTLDPTTDYGTAYNEEGASYQPEIDQETAALQQLGQQQQVSQASLDQAKANAFKDNSLTSNARGLLFSGYAPSQNDAYVTNTYNPNVNKLNTDTANSAQSLQDKITEINNERATAAQTLVSDTTNAQQQAAASAAKQAASSAKSAASASQPTTNQIANQISTNLAKVTGVNGKVSPQDYAAAYIDWINNGQSASTFNTQFSKYKDPTNGYYDYAITEAIKRGS